MTRELTETYLLGERLSSPLILGSGTVGETYEPMIDCLKAGAGSVCTRSLRIRDRREFPVPRYVIRPDVGYMLNCEIGNETPWTYWKEHLREVQKYGPVILAVSARNPEDAKTLINWFEDNEPPFCYEVNFSCPHSAKMHGPIDGGRVIEVTKHIRDRGAKSMVKFSLNNYNPEWVDKFSRYTDGFVLSNTIGPGVEIDHETGKPWLGAGYGGLSGSALKPLVLAKLIEMRGVTDKDIVGVGGIDDFRDVLQYIRAGANAVQIYTRVHVDGPKVFTQINQDLGRWLGQKGVTLDQVRGSSLPYFNAGINYREYRPVINEDSCVDCGACEDVCMNDAIRGHEIDADLCTSCGACLWLCPTESITFGGWNDGKWNDNQVVRNEGL